MTKQKIELKNRPEPVLGLADRFFSFSRPADLKGLLLTSLYNENEIHFREEYLVLD